MISVVKIISSRIEAGVRLIKLLRMGADDVQEAPEVSPFGFDSAVPKDFIGIYAKTGVNSDDLLIGYINRKQVATPGESRIYSTDSSGENVAVDIICRTNGDIEFGGTADNLVGYSELKKGFDQLKADYNKLVLLFNTHVHISAAAGAPNTPTATPGTQSAANITSAKKDYLKTQ
jgi:hypothetical protein